MPLRSRGFRLLAALSVALTLTADAPTALTQSTDGGAIAPYDGGSQQTLLSIFVPNLPNAPFSLTLQTEWSRPMANGGTVTTTNIRPIKRDSSGRIYQERWFLTPKGSNIPPRLNWIEISDPVTHTFYQCIPSLSTLRERTGLRLNPDSVQSGPLPNNRGTRLHEDLGVTSFAGLPVHEYKDTVTINPGELGNDLAMSTVRHYRFCDRLGFNLTSEVEAPQVGHETFTVTEINTNEPDASFFQPPPGYSVLDRRTKKVALSGPPASLLLVFAAVFFAAL